MKDIIWTEYMKYRLFKREFDLVAIEQIVRHTSERYIDNETHRHIAIGKHKNAIILVPYEESETSLTPVTVHATTRRQINFRIKTGRYSNE